MVRFYLDFDGVIAHSAVECINSAFSVWLESDGNKLDMLNFADKSAVKSKIIKYGIANRYLVVPPEHYYCLIDVLASELTGDARAISAGRIKSKFLSSTHSTSVEKMDKFKHNFFSFRNDKLSTQTDAEWVQDNPPTAFIIAFSKLVENYQNEVLIVSRKNFHAIEKWSVGSKLSLGKIYGNEELCGFKNNKFELIESLQQEYGFQKAFFVDDMVSEFESVDWRAIGVTTLVAGWGYNNHADNTKVVLKTIKGYLDDLHY